MSTFDADGRRYFTAMLRDLSEGQRAANQLRECQRRLSDLLSNVELVAVMLDRTASIDYCNDYFLTLTGWRREEVLGKSFFELFVPSELHHHLRNAYASMLANLAHSRHHENPILTRSGEHRLIRWNNSVLRSIRGDVIGITSIGEDVTEQQRSDSHRQAAESRLHGAERDQCPDCTCSGSRRARLNEGCRIADDAGTFAMAWIGVIDSRIFGGREVVAWYGGQEAYVSEVRLTARDEDTPDSGGPACRALRQSQP